MGGEQEMFAMVNEIKEALKSTAESKGARILYAVESGSRAWGFASTDSDFDVRFLYVRPLVDYLQVRERRDVIEAMLPHDIDLSGWDLRKTLSLLVKSNPSLFEWLESPIVYTSDDAFMTEFRPLARKWYSEERLFKHYLHMAVGNWRAYLQGEEVSRKKYLYVLRPTLACRWIEEGRGVVPMLFSELRQVVSEDRVFSSAIDVLLEQKMRGVELAVGPRDLVLHDYLATELPRLEAIKMRPSELPSMDELDSFFRRWVLATS